MGGLDGEQTHLGRATAIGGKTTDMPARGQYPMTGHDQRKRIASQSLAHRARQISVSQPARQLAVRTGCTRLDFACGKVDALRKRREQTLLVGATMRWVETGWKYQ